jgi:putative component of toxin-antitoxin plasmid stabilization module
MWEVQPGVEYIKRVNRWPKKYRREYAAVHDHLDTFMMMLRGGAELGSFRLNWMHPEPQGVTALTEQGGGPGLKATRLYIYAAKETEIVHLIILGDKSSQPADIRYASDFVIRLTQSQDREQTNG